MRMGGSLCPPVFPNDSAEGETHVQSSGRRLCPPFPSVVAEGVSARSSRGHFTATAAKSFLGDEARNPTHNA